jgi:hypothetical protein
MMMDISFQQVFDAVHTGNFKLAAAFALVLVVALIRKGSQYFTPFKWFTTDKGGALLALLGGVFGAVASGLVAGHAFNLELVTDGMVVGFTAAGGWTAVKKFLAPTPPAPPAT